MTPETSQPNAESSAMAAGKISLYASFETVMCFINEQPVDTSRYTPISWVDNPTHMYSYIAFIVDRRTGSVVATAAHAGPSGETFYNEGHQDPGVKNVPDEIVHKATSDHILIFIWASVIDEYDQAGLCLLSPQDSLMQYLVSAGATPGWQSYIDQDFLTTIGPGVYALVGVFGRPGEGVESKAIVYLTGPRGEELPSSPSADLTVPLSLLHVDGELLWTLVR